MLLNNTLSKPCNQDSQRLPILPPEISWGVRQLCYGVRKLRRGYGRLLPALASMVPSLQEVTIDTEHYGQVCLDLRETVCIPVFVHGCYNHQNPEDRVLDHLLSPGMKVFDIGANIGYYTVFFSRRVKDKGLVVAVEPMPRAIRLLKSNGRLCETNIVIEQSAIGSEPGEAQLNELRHLDCSFVRFGQSGSGSSVKVRTIDQLTEKYGQPDLLKIDVEGAELLALKGASATLSKGVPPTIMIEFIASNAAQFGGYALTDLLECFPEDRFKVYQIMSPGQLRELNKDKLDGTNNYLVVPLIRLLALAPLLASSST